MWTRKLFLFWIKIHLKQAGKAINCCYKVFFLSHTFILWHYQKLTTFCPRELIAMRLRWNGNWHAHLNQIVKMAPSRARERVNYKWLNELCSADLSNEPRKNKRKSNSNMFVVERVISKRQGKKVREHICACTWIANRTLNNHFLLIHKLKNCC